MTAARGVLVALLACIGVGALTLSASSTWLLATRSGVHSVQFAAIAVLELANIVGTVMWLRAADTRGRVEAGALVVGASVVTAIGGLGAYGLFGLVGPAFLVASVHVSAREFRPPITDTWEPVTGPPTEELPRMADTVPAVVTEPDTLPDDADIDWSLSERKLAMALGITRHAARQLKAERAEASA